MVISDKEALKELKRVRSLELDMSIDDYPENERDGRSDMQMIADECSYILSNFEEYGHVLHDDLQEAKELIRKTKNGKVIPLWKSTLRPVCSRSDIQIARNTINEHRRLQNLMKRLNAKGFYGKW